MTIYPFGLPNTNPPLLSDQDSLNLLGGKGSGLVWMTNRGYPVPPGFIIPTTVWEEYTTKPKTTIKLIKSAIKPYLKQLKEHFGYMPLLSVRSGARQSMPGMMDTVLNVGLLSGNASEWIKRIGEKAEWDSVHRLVTMYGSVVKGIDRKLLEDSKFPVGVYLKQTGEEFPNAEGQLLGCIEAVFKSWNNPRAKIYRKANGIPDHWGTAVTVQAMVFGNMNDQSATGVLFTRNPDTGEDYITGEFLVNAQGEDVVAGIRTPQPLTDMAVWDEKLLCELLDKVHDLEDQKKDAQDVEFTIQDGKLYFLQTRNAKRTPAAALKIACDMQAKGLITAEVAVRRVTPRQLDLAEQVVVDPKFDYIPLARGLSACSGVVTGRPVFTVTDALECKEPCILISDETTPDDIAGMMKAVGVITMKGGATSHAAVVARGMNKPCIVGVGLTTGDMSTTNVLSMDGSTGNIWLGTVPTIKGAGNEYLRKYKSLVAEVSKAQQIITEVPETDMETALYVPGVEMVDPLAVASKIELMSKRVSKLYVDLSKPEDNPFLSTFCGMEAELANRLSNSNLANPVFVVTESPMICFNGNVKFVGNVTDLERMITSEGPLTINSSVVVTPAMQRVLSWRMQEGVEVISLGHVADPQNSFISFEQALQEINK